ncbi:MAG: Ppx/GppA family phosphatase [Caulobacteraceae bacterium]|nr:Ppx/GppA family phosphatase [Caulobacter sp.]
MPRPTAAAEGLAAPPRLGEDACDAAVVDIGSNSVRLVTYRLEGRAVWTSYNEKVLAGLGQGVAETGRLSAPGVQQALAALRRFRALIDGAGVRAVFAVATAAVREAQDGAAFAERVEAEAGFPVRVLSGAEEAHYSALGVLAGQPDAAGVVGDLGGSSLELVRLGAEGPGEGVTLPLGPFAVAAGRRGFDPAAVRREATARLKACAPRFRTAEFHAVGGAWRNLALLHMRRVGYPLEVVHEYQAPASPLVETARIVARQSRASLEKIEGVSKKRGETLPHAAVVLETLVEALGVERVRISAYGVREGLLLEAMAPEVRRADPLIAGCRALGERQGMAHDLGPALEVWLLPLWRSLPPVFPVERGRALLAAACRLADVGARLHPDHRADLAYEQVLRAPVAGQTHPERAFLAAAVFARYTSASPERTGPLLERVLSPDQLKRARLLGAALRLGCDVSGRSPTLLAGAELLPAPDRLRLHACAGHADLLLGEQTRKRLGTLAEALGVPPELG